MMTGKAITAYKTSQSTGFFPIGFPLAKEIAKSSANPLVNAAKKARHGEFPSMRLNLAPRWMARVVAATHAKKRIKPMKKAFSCMMCKYP